MLDYLRIYTQSMALIETSQFFSYLRVILVRMSSNAGLFAHIGKSLKETWKFFCVCAQKFLTVILDTKSSSVGLFAHICKSFIEMWKSFAYMCRNSKINSDLYIS